MIIINHSQLYFPNPILLPWKEIDWFSILGDDNISVDFSLSIFDNGSVKDMIFLPQVEYLGASLSIAGALVELINGRTCVEINLRDAAYYWKFNLLQDRFINLKAITCINPIIPKQTLKWDFSTLIFAEIELIFEWEDFVVPAINFQRQAFYDVFRTIPELLNHEEQEYLHLLFKNFHQSDLKLRESLKR